MSYALTRRIRPYGLGIDVSASFSTASDVATKAPTTKTIQDGANAAGVKLPDCSDVAIPDAGGYINQTLVKCCQDIRKMSGLSFEDKAKGVAKCAGRGAGTAACLALGPVTAGISVALAPLCGSVGEFVVSRVEGWSTGQWIGAGIGAALCTVVSAGALAAVCAFAGAELIGWLSDALGPVLEGIFHPGAKAAREKAARAAFHALDEATVKFRLDADDAMRSLWSQSIGSLKAAYTQSMSLLSPANQTKMVQILGFAPAYDGVAKAFVAAGGASTPLNWATDQQGGTVGARLRANRANGGSGCESSAAGCLRDGYSEVCPFSFNDYFMAFWNLINWKGTSRDQQMAFDRKMHDQMLSIAGAIFAGTQKAITDVTTNIALVAASLHYQQLMDEAKAANEAKLLASASKAAAKAQAAAKQATSWSSDMRASALIAAQNQYTIAKQARTLLLFAPSSATSSASQQKMSAAVARAAQAVTDANANARHVELVLGAGATAGVAALGYFLLRRLR